MNASALSLQWASAPLASPQSPVGTPYLRLQLSSQTPALFLMHQVQEVLMMAAQQVTPMPNMPACVLGLATRRSRVMWVVDLARLLLGTPFVADQRSYDVIILRATRQSLASLAPQASTHRHLLLGAIVPAMQGVLQLEGALAAPLSDQFTPSVTACLRGCLPHQDDIWPVLDADAIARAIRLRTQSFHS